MFKKILDSTIILARAALKKETEEKY